MACDHGAGGRGAQRCMQGHFRQKHRIAGIDPSQNTKGSDPVCNPSRVFLGWPLTYLKP